ncbi:hypothetical protein QJS10_CPB17g01684 [Acorus calamus]|uniref:Uncharacterized protein n=1 Tax=Acorus calamus TaxID=4465 RepID=A0AAV9CWK3_ACOCL|nr:hypothetical protein QJS10_CPB17g01684 [Acorus calamus]
MEEREFQRLLHVFPIVRSRDYCADVDSSRESDSSLGQNVNGWDEDDNDVTETRRSEFEDPFWEKLRLAAERKVGPSKAEQFCKAFQRVHKKLVHEELTVDAAQRILDSSASAARAT